MLYILLKKYILKECKVFMYEKKHSTHYEKLLIIKNIINSINKTN